MQESSGTRAWRDPDTGETLLPMQLGYCPRCGGLHIFPAQEERGLCPGCRRELGWIYSGKHPARAAAAPRDGGW